MTIAIERQEDGRWLSEVLELPGVTAYGVSRRESADRVKALALRAIADRLDAGEDVPDIASLFLMTA